MPPAEVRCLRQLLSKRAAARTSGEDGPSTPHSNDSEPNPSSSGNRASESQGSSKGKHKSDADSSSSSVGVKSSSSGRRPSSVGVVPPWQANASEALLAAAPRSSIARPSPNTRAPKPAPKPAPATGAAKVVEAGEGQSLNDALAATGFFTSVGDSNQSALI